VLPALDGLRHRWRPALAAVGPCSSLATSRAATSSGGRRRWRATSASGLSPCAWAEIP